MSRILYVECRNGEPYADAQGVVIATTGPSTPPLPPQPWEWLPYVPASELESRDGLIECLKADRDSADGLRQYFVAERNQALARVDTLRARLTQERSDHLLAEDGLLQLQLPHPSQGLVAFIQRVGSAQRKDNARAEDAEAKVRELEGLFERWQNAAARIAAPYHSDDALKGEGCPRFCQSCQERRTIRDAILAMKPEDVP